MSLVNVVDPEYFREHGPYIVRCDTDEFVYVGGRDGECGISGDPFTLGWAIRWYGEGVGKMNVGDRLPILYLH